MVNKKERFNKNPKSSFFLSVGLIVLLTSCNNNSNKKEKIPETKIQHGIVFYEEGRFGGWPANNGIWSWDNEILVGFVVADHKEKTGHTYEPLTASNKYARSKD